MALWLYGLVLLSRMAKCLLIDAATAGRTES